MPDILIVDDEPGIQKLLQQALDRNGYYCCCAGNAGQARNLLAERSFDLLITDINMPGESGIDFAKDVAKKYPDLAIIIITANDDPQTADSLLRAGVYGYIVKPFKCNQLLITVVNALIRRELEVEAKFLRDDLEKAVHQRTAKLSRLVKELKDAKKKVTDYARYLNDQLLFKQTLLDAIPNPIFYKDTQGSFLGCNSRFGALFGVSQEAIVGKTAFDISPRDKADFYGRTDRQLIDAPGKISYETQVTDPQGASHDFEVTKATFANTDGKIAGVIGAMVEITNRKKMEQKLRTSEEKIRQTLDNIGIGVALISPGMKILEMNRQMRTWFPQIAMDSQPVCFEVFHTPAKTRPCGNCPTVKALGDGQIHEATVETSIRGAIRKYRLVATPIHDSSGKVEAAIEMVEDITEKLAMERELLQAQKLASIGQLAAGVAHEINNPVGFVSSNLTTLDGYHDDLNRLVSRYQAFKLSVAALEDPSGLQDVQAEAVKIDSLEDEIDIDFVRQDASDLLGECKQGTERIKKIVEDLKHFAHPGQDKVQDTDINRELESTLNVVHNELKYKATVTKTFDELPIISANPQQLNQVFVNILVNAAQAIEKSGEIRIQTQHRNGHVEIRISDTGCGIPEESLAKIFDPFFTTKEVGKGTGLGLNIAFNIIKKHQGEMLVQSRVGQGTTFIIKLPVSAPGVDVDKTNHFQEQQACSA